MSNEYFISTILISIYCIYKGLRLTTLKLSGFWPLQNLGSREGNGSRWPPEGFAVAEPQPLHARAARSSEALPAVR